MFLWEETIFTKTNLEDINCFTCHIMYSRPKYASCLSVVMCIKKFFLDVQQALNNLLNDLGTTTNNRPTI